MTVMNVKSLAIHLNQAEYEKREVTSIQAEHPEMTVGDAYKIQEELVGLKLQEGHRIIGPKMGLTSRAKMKQMNVEEPIYGYVFDYMVVPDKTLYLNELIHPKVEAEIAFILGKDIEGPNVTIEQVIEATEYVAPALEIIDSRYKDFKFTLPDVIADNASSSKVFMGSTFKRPQELELDLVGVTLSINGEIKELGASAAVLGHPAESLVLLARMLSRKGLKLKAGQVILTGGITGAVMLSDGDVVQAKWDGLGSIEFTVKK
ncbi:2-keto-4-pentenoate hydratase [Paenibacillus alginolyticus]|uniref:Fumarylacetoacetate hydrolase family protein n=1 Tax=Paenibacillus alginolyticus TaxID=59839 RepID=A0ABT4GH15_9BACL|nr:fumarylacetoacetate hydrolase family protein [Paenibacillus alginolyticus]MCY9695480.1 fumarylacetoacetate hydrolase family protein [Paenibacillus alginolyticus]MEC0146341.1 fumarylacetoacetate hydrolase family protein [Paenibacillus alginolyticus]